MRRIAVFTATRAEYGLLRPVLHCLEQANDCTLQLIVSGTHLSQRHGFTLDEILADGFRPDAQLDLHLDDGVLPNAAAGRVVAELGPVLQNLAPHLLLLLGDRYETLAAGLAATLHALPLAHIHGGEVTRGALDDAFRHALTQLSQLHFASTAGHRRRILQLGQPPEQVWNVGALGVENVHSLPLPTEQEIRTRLHLPAARPYALCTWHPETREPGTETTHLCALFTALEAFPALLPVFTAANADPGGENINQMLRAYAAKQDFFRYVPSMGTSQYLATARYATCVVGNSSSGILELPSLGVPVINVGTRQDGRECSTAVLHCPAHAPEIVAALSTALSAEHIVLCAAASNPYDKPGTAATIAAILRSFPLQGILHKKFYDLPAEPFHIEKALLTR